MPYVKNHVSANSFSRDFFVHSRPEGDRLSYDEMKGSGHAYKNPRIVVEQVTFQIENPAQKGNFINVAISKSELTMLYKKSMALEETPITLEEVEEYFCD